MDNNDVVWDDAKPQNDVTWDDAPSTKSDIQWDDASPRQMTNDEETALRARQTADKRDSYLESQRFSRNLGEAWRGTMMSKAFEDPDFQKIRKTVADRDFWKMRYESAVKGDDDIGRGRAYGKILDAEDTLKQMKPQIDAMRDKRTRELREYTEIPDWYNGSDFLDNLTRMSKSVSGQVLGSIATPENFVPAGRGGSALRTAIRGFLANAPAGALNNLHEQMFDNELGIRKGGIDWDEVLRSGGMSGALGGVMHAAGQHGRIFNEAKALGPSGESLGNEAARAQDLNAKFKDQTKPEDAYPDIQWDDEAQKPGLEQSQKEAMASADESANQGPFRDVALPQEQDPNHGFGQDVGGDINSPYLGKHPGLDDEAEPGIGEMQLLPGEGNLKDVDESGKMNPFLPQGEVDAFNSQHLLEGPATKQMTLPLGQIKKGQAGNLDVGAFWEGIKKVGEYSDDMKEAFLHKLNSTTGWFETPEEMRSYLDTNKIADIGEFTGNFNMQNQVAQAITDNPVPSFTFNYLQTRARKAEVRMNEYWASAKDSVAWTKQNVKDAVDFFRQWEHDNADPNSSQLRSQLDADPAMADAYWSAKIGKDAYQMVKPLIDVMGHVWETDNKYLGDMGRPLTKEGQYFPLMRSGPYHVTVVDDTGATRAALGYDNLADAHHFKDNLDLPEGWEVSLEKSDPSRILNPAMQEALLTGAPKWLQDAAMSSLKQRMQFQRQFEMGRSTTNLVEGLIGQIEPKSETEYAKMLEKYLSVFANRVRQSHHLENAAAAVEISNALLQDGSVIRENNPGTAHWLEQVLGRHIGLDLGQWDPFDHQVQAGIEKVGRIATIIDGALKGYKPGENDNVVSKNLAKAVMQGMTYFSSLWKIGLSGPTLASNLLQNAVISLDGARNAYRYGVPDVHALSAQAKAMAYMLSPDKKGTYPEVWEAMQQAKKEGLIDPHGREDYTTVETLDKRWRSGAMDAVDTAVQAPRNAIERFTNYNAMVYYNFFVRDAFPELKGTLRDNAIVNMAKSFSGDYSQPANLMIFDKMFTGHLFSTFSRWKFNQIGRYIDDIGAATGTGGQERTGVMPLMLTVAINGMMAGVMGQVGLVEYESIRQGLKKLFDINMKPLSAIVNDAMPDSLTPAMKTFVERGAFTALADSIAGHYGQNSGPDWSTSMRASSIFEAQTTTLSTMGDVAQAVGVGAKAALSKSNADKFIESMPSGTAKDLLQYMTENNSKGVSNSDMKKLTQALPSAVQELVYSQFVTEVMKNGEKKFIKPELGKDEGNYERNAFQQNLAMYGLNTKTTDEHRYYEAKNEYKFKEEQRKQLQTSLKEGFIHAMDTNDAARAKSNAIQMAKEFGPNHVLDMANELATGREKRQLDFFTLQEMSAFHRKDPVDKAKEIEILKDAADVKLQRTSKDRSPG